MSQLRTELQADVCVVGGGMVGLAHALEARRRGLSVVVLDRDRAAVGASVRNFGHLYFASQPDGPVFDLALRSRERWLELAPRAGIELVAEGTLVLARAADELAVMETALVNEDRRARMVTVAEATRLAPLPPTGLLGGLHSTLDLRTSPRAAVAGLARLLEDDADATLVWNRHVHAVEPGVVHADASSGDPQSTTVRAPLIIVCPGPDFRSLAPELRPGLEGLTRCRLQMLRVATPAGRRFGPALATGLSLIRYPAFAGQAPTAALASRLARERPELLENGIHLLITQLPASSSQLNGDLIIGDSHAYGDTLDEFADERIFELLLEEAAGLLGVGRLAVKERWLGIYATRSQEPSTYAPFHVTRPMEGVRVVENVAGIGMTLSLGFAAEVLNGADQLVGAAI